MSIKFIANTNKKQDLKKHLDFVSHFSLKFFEENFSEKDFENLKERLKDGDDIKSSSSDAYNAFNLINSLNYNEFKDILYISAFFHDIGKVNYKFQEYLQKIINNKSKNKECVEDYSEEELDGNNKNGENEVFLYHEELSVIITKFFMDLNLLDELGEEFKNLKTILDKFKLKNSNEGNGFSNESFQLLIFHLIYWHHASKILINKGEVPKGLFDKFKDFHEKNSKIKSKIVEDLNVFFNISSFDFNDIGGYSVFKKISYKYYIDSDSVDLNLYNINERVLIAFEAIKTALRISLIEADRFVSGLDEIDNNSFEYYYKDFNNYISSKNKGILNKSDESEITFKKYSQYILDNFKKNEIDENNRKRSLSQFEVAKKLNDNKFSSIKVLQGPAGCGKTKIIFDWINQNENNEKINKLFIVVPRKVIGLSIFDELSKEDVYFKNNKNIKIKLINGDVVKLYHNGCSYNLKDENINLESSDCNIPNANINIVTIDYIISLLKSHNDNHLIFQMINSYVVFDEYHEIYESKNMVFMLKEFIELKRLSKIKNTTLFVSATPNYFFTKKILEINKNDIVSIKSFNDKLIKIRLVNHFDKSNYNFGESGSIYIHNTAISSQKQSIKMLKKSSSFSGYGLINFHSKLTQNDRKNAYEKIVDNFGKGRFTKKYNIQSGPLLQASINISTNKMYSDLSSPENLLQRLGRLNRFAEFDDNCSEFNIIKPENDKILESSLNHFNIVNQSKAFLNYLRQHYLNKNLNKNKDNEDYLSSETEEFSTTLNELYSVYENFHKEHDGDYESDYINGVESIKKTFKNLSYFAPIEYKNNKSNKNNKSKIGNTLRGGMNSVYVKAIVYDFNTKTTIKEEGGKEEKYSDVIVYNLTVGDKNRMETDFFIFNLIINGESGNNARKNINNKKKTNNYKDIILKEFKSSSNPLYMSFSETDKKLHKKENVENLKRYIYIKNANVAIGLMDLENDSDV